jgi:hypothetical protein
MTTKKCSLCNKEKDTNEFYKDLCMECATRIFRLSNIYIIEANGSYKIGESKYPEKRLKQLQTGNHCWLKIIKIYKNIECAKAVEKLLHKRLDFCHLEGEWFKCDIDKIYKIIEDTLNELKDQSSWYS